MKGALFSESFARVNRLEERGFARWVFHPGMLFDAGEKWWGNPGPRGEAHPGLDLCAFETLRGDTAWLQEGARVPAAFGGRVVAIMDDFLGHTAVVEHEDGEERICTFYAHTVPRPDLRVGDAVAGGEVIAAIAGTSRLKSGIRPHLHLSLARVNGPVSYPELDWRTLAAIDALALVDPLPVLDLPRRIL